LSTESGLEKHLNIFNINFLVFILVKKLYAFFGLLNTTMSSTIILFASSRRNGNTGKLTDAIAKELSLEVIDLDQTNISPFDYEHRNRSDDFEPLMEQVLSVENIVFASPVYWYSVAPSMKVFMDRISDYLELPDLLEKGRKLRGKKGYVICTSIKESADGLFMDAFRQTFSYLGIEFTGFIHANCCNGYKAQDYEHDIRTFIERF
jgi:multimeric flavodoxin WrbA